MRRRRVALWSAEAAVAAAKRRLRQRREPATARLVADLTLGINQRAFAFALVHHVQDAGAPNHRALWRDRRMQHEALLAMHDLLPGDADLRPAQPIGRIALHHGEGWQHLEIFFVDKCEFVGVERILAETQPERIEHTVLRAVVVLDRGDLQRQQFFIVEWHYATLAPISPKLRSRLQRSCAACPIARPHPRSCPPRWRQSRIAATDKAVRAARIWPPRRCGA